MKRIRTALKRLGRSEIDDRIEKLHADSRAEIAKLCAEGRGKEGMQANAALLGLHTNGSKPKMIFGRR